MGMALLVVYGGGLSYAFKWFVVLPSIELEYSSTCSLRSEVLFHLSAVDGGAFDVSELVGLSGWWRCYLFDYVDGVVFAFWLVKVFSYFVDIGLVFRWSFTKGSCRWAFFKF